VGKQAAIIACGRTRHYIPFSTIIECNTGYTGVFDK
jgi:hypothetical protein